MREYHDGAYPDYDIRERYPDDILPMDDFPHRCFEEDYTDEDNNVREEEVNPVDVNEGEGATVAEVNPVDVNEGEEDVSIIVRSEEIITISDDDDSVIIEYVPDIIEVVQNTAETTEELNQPIVCLELEKRNHEKKIVMKEKPNKIIRKPYNLANDCELIASEEKNEDIDYYSIKQKKKVKAKLQCGGRNMAKIYKEIPCETLTNRGDEEDVPDIVEVKNARRQKGIGKKSDLKRKKTCQPSNMVGKRRKKEDEEGGEKEENEEEGQNVLQVKKARKQKGVGKKSQKGENEEEGQTMLEVKNARKQKGIGKKSKKEKDDNNNSNDNSAIDVRGVATDLANSMQNLIRPTLRNTQITLEILEMTRSIFEGCARIRTPKSNRKKQLGFLPYIIPPIIAGLTAKAVESHLLSEETHCPKGYIKFGKNCIPKGLCPTGYVKMNF